MKEHLLGVMLDLETMGTKPGSAITSIGAVAFNQEKILDEFYVRITLESCIKAGLTMDPGTVLWWMKQSDEARAELNATGHDLRSALCQFGTWNADRADAKGVPVWGNGSMFDNALLKEAFDRVGLTPPWTHKDDRCYRTLKNLFPNVPLPPLGVKHNALDDARSQALHVIQIAKSLP